MLCTKHCQELRMIQRWKDVYPSFKSLQDTCARACALQREREEREREREKDSIIYLNCALCLLVAIREHILSKRNCFTVAMLLLAYSFAEFLMEILYRSLEFSLCSSLQYFFFFKCQQLRTQFCCCSTQGVSWVCLGSPLHCGLETHLRQ